MYINIIASRNTDNPCENMMYSLFNMGDFWGNISFILRPTHIDTIMWGTVRPCGAKCIACHSAVLFVYVILVGSTSHFMFCVLKRDNPDSFFHI